MAPDPYVLTIAEVNVDGNVVVTSHLPADITLVTGQELHLNVRYTFREQTLERESYRFRLTSQVGDQQPPDREETWHDRPLMRDHLQGFIGHRYKFDNRGTYEGSAQVLAQYLTGKWGSSDQKVAHEATDSGLIRVTVA